MKGPARNLETTATAEPKVADVCAYNGVPCGGGKEGVWTRLPKLEAEWSGGPLGWGVLTAISPQGGSAHTQRPGCSRPVCGV